MVYTVAAVQEGENKASSLAATLTDEVCTRKANFFQTLASTGSTDWSMIPAVIYKSVTVYIIIMYT